MIGVFGFQFLFIYFWGLYLYDREMVRPAFLGEIISVWVYHWIYTLPLVAVFMEQLLVHHTYPSFLRGIAVTFIFLLAYLLW